MNPRWRVLLGLVSAVASSAVCTVLWTVTVGERLTSPPQLLGELIQGAVIFGAVPFLQGIITASVGRLRGLACLLGAMGPLLNAIILALMSIPDKEATGDWSLYAGSLALSCLMAVLGSYCWVLWARPRPTAGSLNANSQL